MDNSPSKEESPKVNISSVQEVHDFRMELARKLGIPLTIPEISEANRKAMAHNAWINLHRYGDPWGYLDDSDEMYPSSDDDVSEDKVLEETQEDKYINHVEKVERTLWPQVRKIGKTIVKPDKSINISDDQELDLSGEYNRNSDSDDIVISSSLSHSDYYEDDY